MPDPSPPGEGSSTDSGLTDRDRFDFAADSLGDLDGDGFADLAVGASLDDDGGADRGAVWLLRLGARFAENNVFPVPPLLPPFVPGGR